MFKQSYLKTFGIILAALLALGFILAGISLFSAFNTTPFIKQEKVDEHFDFHIITAADTTYVCDPITYQMQFSTSLNYQWSPHISFDLPEGIQLAGEPELTPHYRVNHWLYDLKFNLVAYREKTFKKMNVNIKITSMINTAADTTFVVKIPNIKVESANIPEGELAIAGEIPPEVEPILGQWLWAIVLVGLLFICAIVWFLMHRKEQQIIREIEPWIEGETDLISLQEKVRKDNISREKAVGKITDIVRHYLVRRFKLPADAMTTYEFFKKLEYHDSPLEKEHKQFLIEFLNAADLIKFAGLAASSDMVLSAIARALKLIYETTPHEKENEK